MYSSFLDGGSYAAHLMVPQHPHLLPYSCPSAIIPIAVHSSLRCYLPPWFLSCFFQGSMSSPYLLFSSPTTQTVCFQMPLRCPPTRSSGASLFRRFCALDLVLPGRKTPSSFEWKWAGWWDTGLQRKERGWEFKQFLSHSVLSFLLTNALFNATLKHSCWQKHCLFPPFSCKLYRYQLWCTELWAGSLPEPSGQSFMFNLLDYRYSALSRNGSHFPTCLARLILGSFPVWSPVVVGLEVVFHRLLASAVMESVSAPVAPSKVSC